MSDDPKKRGRADRLRVAPTQPHELKYWLKKWGCSEAELLDAIESVGHMAADIERHLIAAGCMRAEPRKRRR